MKLTVRNMLSPKTGSPVANQFVIHTDEGIYFQSYDTTIAVRRDGKLIFDKDSWDYSYTTSHTTSKYRNIFTCMDTKETKQAIKDGRITFENLN